MLSILTYFSRYLYKWKLSIHIRYKKTITIEKNNLDFCFAKAILEKNGLHPFHTHTHHKIMQNIYYPYVENI
jgi:hypothetical protein